MLESYLFTQWRTYFIFIKLHLEIISAVFENICSRTHCLRKMNFISRNTIFDWVVQSMFHNYWNLSNVLIGVTRAIVANTHLYVCMCMRTYAYIYIYKCMHMIHICMCCYFVYDILCLIVSIIMIKLSSVYLAWTRWPKSICLLPLNAHTIPCASFSLHRSLALRYVKKWSTGILLPHENNIPYFFVNIYCPGFQFLVLHTFRHVFCLRVIGNKIFIDEKSCLWIYEWIDIIDSGTDSGKVYLTWIDRCIISSLHAFDIRQITLYW